MLGRFGAGFPRESRSHRSRVRIRVLLRYNQPLMRPDSYNLAIETSSRRGSVTLGRGDALIESADLGEQRRHAVELLPAVDAMCRRHNIRPAEIGEVYVSVGPGSFTGLRIGVTTAKTLGRAIGCRLVAVPTLGAVAQNAPPHHPLVAVLLNAKQSRCYTGLYERSGDAWKPRTEPALLTPAELCELRARLFHGSDPPPPMAVIADKLPDFDWPADVQYLDPTLATPRSEAVWRLGRAAAERGEFTDPLELTPLYVRLPEPEEKWRAKQNA